MSSGEGAGDNNCILWLLFLLLLEISRNVVVADKEEDAPAVAANFSFSLLNFITSSRTLFALSLYSPLRVDWSQCKLSWKRGDWKSIDDDENTLLVFSFEEEGVAGVFLPPITTTNLRCCCCCWINSACACACVCVRVCANKRRKNEAKVDSL